MSKRVRWLVLASAAAMAGCGEDEAPPPPPAAGTAAPADAAPQAGANAAAGKGKSKGAEPTDLPPLPTPDIQERDFLESPANRDPYKTYADLFVIKPKTEQVTIQREVLIQKHSLESLKIVGIVTGSSGRVLVQDPDSLGWVLRVGDFVGQPEVVRSGGAGGGDVAVNWRVDRIRENDVVFVRELPDPTAPATTRVLSLRTQDELRQEIRTGIRGTRPDEGGADEDEPKKETKKAPRKGT